MTVYYVDDGGSATSPYDTWAKAATSLSALDDAITFASGDIVYIGHDHVCQFTHSAHRTITGPASGLPTYIISATQGSSPPAYQASATNQIDTSEGAYNFYLAGVFALYGIKINSGGQVITYSSGETVLLRDCTLLPAAGNLVSVTGDGSSKVLIDNCTIDCTNDGTTGRTGNVISLGTADIEIRDLTFTNVAYRTGDIIMTSGSGQRQLKASGIDMSGATNATTCELIRGSIGCPIIINNVLTKASPTLVTTDAATAFTDILIVNAGEEDSPPNMRHRGFLGDTYSSVSVYRTGGATVEAVATSWLITTNAACGEGAPYGTPWIYGTVNTVGSRTFTIYITNDTADFYNNQVWIEVEHMAIADSGKWTLITDQRPTITSTPALQGDDTTSTWNGSGPAFTYKQKLSVTANVGEEGQFRARVAVGKASITSGSYFYIDPDVKVS
jgi:hypothetical protein